jgi:hypothetical protein
VAGNTARRPSQPSQLTLWSTLKGEGGRANDTKGRARNEPRRASLPTKLTPWSTLKGEGGRANDTKGRARNEPRPPVSSSSHQHRATTHPGPQPNDQTGPGAFAEGDRRPCPSYPTLPAALPELSNTAGAQLQGCAAAAAVRGQDVDVLTAAGAGPEAALEQVVTLPAAVSEASSLLGGTMLCHA